jgi:pimeloyl-ACP methyl ester carboxylesterase
MVPPKPSQKKPAPQPPQYRNYPPRPPAGPPEVVDPVWLLKALASLIVAALICGYGTLCFLLYQGQWQLILHPKQTTSYPARIGDAPVAFLRFGPDESGVPQRTGWSVAAAPGARYAQSTVLFLPSGDGSLADSVPTLDALHELGVNLFAIDYRGYGQSAATHPNQQRMLEDATSAWQFLTTARGVPEGQIVLYGTGLGASIATHLAVEHGSVPALVLDTPGPDPIRTVLADPRTSVLPVRLLLHDRFPLALPLTTLKTPKLLLSPGTTSNAFSNAASPKLMVSLPKPRSTTIFTESVVRFLDQYLSSSHPVLLTPTVR